MAYWHSLTVILLHPLFCGFSQFFHHHMACESTLLSVSTELFKGMYNNQESKDTDAIFIIFFIPLSWLNRAIFLWTLKKMPHAAVYTWWPWGMNGRVQCRFDWQLLPTQACLTPATALHYPGLPVSYLQSSLACNESLAMHYSWSTLKDPLLHSERPRERERGRSAHHQGMIPFGLGYQIGHHTRVRARPWIYGWALLI